MPLKLGPLFAQTISNSHATLHELVNATMWGKYLAWGSLCGKRRLLLYVLKFEAIRSSELSMNQMDEGPLSAKVASLEMWVKEIENDIS